MLQKVVAIKSVGLLHETGTSPRFGKTTLLFAENGRGKSTFCQLLKSLSDGDMSVVAKKKTLDGEGPTSATLVFDKGPSTSQLVSDIWSHARPEIRVFDTQFVSRNIYAGASIDVDHRRNLLQFALGDAAVAEASRERTATDKAAELRAAIRSAEESLVPHHPGLSLAAFIGLPKVVDVDEKVHALDLRITSSKRKEALFLRKLPNPISIPTWDLEASLHALARTLDGIENESERLVVEHLALLEGEATEPWIAQGLAFEHGDDCPYCGQSVAGLPLIRAYRGYFGESYRAHLAQLNDLSRALDAATGEKAVAATLLLVKEQQVLVEQWSDVLELDALSFVEDEFRESNASVRSSVAEAFSQRIAAPLDSLLVELDRTALALAIADLDARVGDVNSKILQNRKSVEAFRLSLETEDVASFIAERDRALLGKVRHGDSIAAVIAKLASDRIEATAAEKARDESRASVRNIMNSTLEAYQADINELLTQFGAAFSIQEMKTNFRGSSPQSEYAIGLRSRSVALKDELGPDFDSSLSDGDKRTLAFAFFAASVAKDPSAADLILVVDDPMSSMDATRRTATINVLMRQQQNSAQLVLSSHDPNFLKEFRQASLRADKHQDIQEIELGYAANGYSAWLPASIDKLCESVFSRMHRETVEFVDSGVGDAHTVGSHLRPLLEGYLHSRFPSHIADGLLLGECIAAIRAALSPSPLAFAQRDVDEIETINTFVGRFHHSTAGAGAAALPNAGEVRTFATRALDVLHGRPLVAS